MALSIRGCGGRSRPGMTNCLNFASRSPGKFYELEQSSRVSDTCRDLDCPVVSGNVSLNETASDRSIPLPRSDRGTCQRQDSRLPSKASSGDSLIVERPLGSLGASRYQVMRKAIPKASRSCRTMTTKAFQERPHDRGKRRGIFGTAVAGGDLPSRLQTRAWPGCGLSVKTDISAPRRDPLL